MKKKIKKEIKDSPKIHCEKCGEVFEWVESLDFLGANWRDESVMCDKCIIKNRNKIK